MALTIEQAESRVILKILVGSHVHGLNIEAVACAHCNGTGIIETEIGEMISVDECLACKGTGRSVKGSDRDEEAIIIEPLAEAVKLGKPWEDMDRVGETVDVKYFSLRKWCMMACKGNPNFLLMLFAPRSHILSMDSRGGQLRDMREAFISKQAIKSHLGYMQGQRQRMLNQIACHEEVGRNGGHGRPRHDLCEKYGYDVKFGMHLLRLGLQGAELALHGRITLPMPEEHRQNLLNVRAGNLPLEYVLGYAEDLEAQMKAAFDSSQLPDEPDHALIEEWMQRTYIRTWSAERRLQDIREDETVFNVVRRVM